MEAILEARNVSMHFGGLRAVDTVDFVVEQDAIASLIGPNGAGKTTFFNMVTGLHKPTAGKIFFDGQDLSGKQPNSVTALGSPAPWQLSPSFSFLTNRRRG